MNEIEERILRDLNPSQNEAVRTIDGPLMVIAGAGSGKTKVLTCRVAWLIAHNVDPFSILALTFTNKAASEMKERIHKMVGNEARNVWMGTFHSVFSKILHIEHEKIGYPQNYTIYDADDSKRMIKKIVSELNLDPKVYKANYIYERISSSKTALLSATEYCNDAELQRQDTNRNVPQVGQIFNRYQIRLKQSGAMDFDDLLFNMNILLRDFPDVLYKYQQKFKFILVDEYQDTNFSQYLIVKKLAANNENICVVGDDAQSIYAFRGANIQNILNFKKDYPDYKLVKLEQNYRSTKVIVEASNNVIKNNKEQINKVVWTSNSDGDKIKVIQAQSDGEEGVLVANSIFENKMNFQLDNSDFAILYRSNIQSRAFEEALRKRNIPYKIHGWISFYKQKEIKDILAYFRLVINNKDEDALSRIINYPTRGIGDVTFNKIILAANEAKMSPWDILEQLDVYKVPIMSTAKTKIDAFVTMIKNFSAQLETKNAFDLASAIVRGSGILKTLNDDKTPENISRIESIEELLKSVQSSEESKLNKPVTEDNDTETPKTFTLIDFMEDIALLTDSDDKEEEQDNNKVILMTVHAAKGLEFPYVYVVGMEENLFPNIQSLANRTELEEERRLFYVAVTRAKKQLILSHAKMRFRWGEVSFSEPSRFLSEINENLLDLPKKAQADPQANLKYERKSFNRFESRNYSTSSQTTSEPTQKVPSNLKKITDISNTGSASQNLDIKIGSVVVHKLFGRGVVKTIEGNEPANKKATIEFDEIGPKQLLLHFARLQVIQ